jgi:GNAT superfamily N-acetyltransferase
MNGDTNSPGTDYRFDHLTAYSPEVVEQIQAIYEVSFPAYERKPFWYVADAMHSGHYTVYVIRRERGGRVTTGEIVAFALLARLRTSQAMYIEYLAVDQALRGQGIGSLLLRSMIGFLDDTPATAIIWEVDPPIELADDNSRRIQFYERFGAHLIEKSTGYGMPNYYKGSGTLPLRLMWKPLHDAYSDQPTKAELVAFITDIYETEYRGFDNIRDEIIASLG